MVKDFTLYIGKIVLPDKIFFTGVPGSRWSGIAQTLENLPGFNISDRSDTRKYNHNKFSGHQGAYFGPGMEFEDRLEPDYLDSAWSLPGNCKLVKSHNWAYKLYDIRVAYPNAWIMLVYRPDIPSYTWWKEAGGFNIKYPCYDWYCNDTMIFREIQNQNREILKFAEINNLTWQKFTTSWINTTFGNFTPISSTYDDVLVTIIN